jgi:hypothetical protein
VRAPTKEERAAIFRYVVASEMGYAVLFKDVRVAEKYGYGSLMGGLTKKAAPLVQAHRRALQLAAASGEELSPNERHYLRDVARCRR